MRRKKALPESPHAIRKLMQKAREKRVFKEQPLLEVLWNVALQLALLRTGELDVASRTRPLGNDNQPRPWPRSRAKS